VTTSVTDTVSDVWSSSARSVQDLAATAAELATEVVEQLEDLPDKVVGLASAARSRIGPAPRRSRKPWLFLAAAVAGVLVVAWLWRRRAATTPAVDIGPDGRPNPVREHGDASRSAVGT
jgi:hypothetical protein